MQPMTFQEFYRANWHNYVVMLSAVQRAGVQAMEDSATSLLPPVTERTLHYFLIFYL